MVERLPAVVPLHNAHHLRRGTANILQPSNTQARLQAEGDFRMRVRELLLHELERRERPLELVPLERIFSCLRKTRLEGAHHAPGDPEARAVKAGESGTEAHRTGHQSVLWSFDVVHKYGACDGSTQRKFVVDFWRGESFHSLQLYGIVRNHNTM